MIAEAEQKTALDILRGSAHMMNLVFGFLDGNTIVHKIRPLCKKYKQILEASGPSVSGRVIKMIIKEFYADGENEWKYVQGRHYFRKNGYEGVFSITDKAKGAETFLKNFNAKRAAFKKAMDVFTKMAKVKFATADRLWWL